MTIEITRKTNKTGLNVVNSVQNIYFREKFFYISDGNVTHNPVVILLIIS